MVGIRLIIIMAIVGGLIAYIADKMGSKIGKKKMSVFGLRPKYTSILLTVISGILISVITIVVMVAASKSARTALFGMEKIQHELTSLNKEKLAATDALLVAQQEVDSKNKSIADLDLKIKANMAENDAMEEKLAAVNDKYLSAQREVASLSEAKKQLNLEIDKLEEATDRLRKGLITIREGQVFYRAGEVVYAGVLRGGTSPEESRNQVNWLLQNANESALERLGIAKNEEKLQAIWIAKKVVDGAVDKLEHSKGNLLVRIRTVANIVVGELVVCNIEMVENEFIYADNTLVHSEVIDLEKVKGGYDSLILQFLTNVNHLAVKAGVLPDPLTGKVGNMDAATMVETGNKMRRLGGKVVLKAYARGDITTAGPVLLRLDVEPYDK